MVNTIWKEVFLIMCSHLKENARHSGRFPLVLRITDDYTLQMLCGDPHNICNEEGKLNGMEYNRAIRDENGEVREIIAGPFLIVGLGEEDFTSLPEDMVQKYKRMFAQPEVFLQTQSSLLILPYAMDEFSSRDDGDLER